MRTVKERPGVVAPAILAFASMAFVLAAGTASAKPITAGSCNQKYLACQSRCSAAIPKDVKGQAWNDKVLACMRRTCDKQYDNCMKNAVGSGGSKAEPPRDPIHPKGGNPRTPPIGGTKDEPKPPPKVNDTRPPMGGGVFQPKTPSGGNEGPILHSGGSQGPILKSSGGGGPSFRSNGQR